MNPRTGNRRQPVAVSRPSCCTMAMLSALLSALLSARAVASMPAPLDVLGRTVVGIERDRYGRMCAPVMLNGKGPFQLIVDSGANHSAVNATVAQALGLPPQDSAIATLHGVTGTSAVPSIQVDSMSVGRLGMPPARLPVVPDIGDVDGFLGLSELTAGRLVIDFDRRQMAIAESAAPEAGTVRIPAQLSAARMLIVDAHIRGIRVRAIIDTGAEATIANLALLRALGGADSSMAPPDRIVGTTAQELVGRTAGLPQIELGSLRIRGARASYGDMPIFGYYHLAGVPSMLLGMDVIGQFASLSLDYAHREIQLTPHPVNVRKAGNP